MKVQFSNPRTGQIKSVKVGWNWGLFLSGGFIGLPLFLSGLCTWGAVMASLWVFSFIILDGLGTVILSVIGIGLSIFFGVKGNEMIAKRYLMHGWQFVNPENDIVKIAKKQWGIKTEAWESPAYSFIEREELKRDCGSIGMEGPGDPKSEFSRR